jgi:hypothetical protein
MLDIGLFRSHAWGDPRIVRESQRRRRADEGLVNTVVALDAEWRRLTVELQDLSREVNDGHRQFKRRGGGASAAERGTSAAEGGASAAERGASAADGGTSAAEGGNERERIRALKASIRELAAWVGAKEDELKKALLQVGNVVHQDAPHGAEAQAPAAIAAEQPTPRVPLISDQPGTLPGAAQGAGRHGLLGETQGASSSSSPQIPGAAGSLFQPGASAERITRMAARLEAGGFRIHRHADAAASPVSATESCARALIASAHEAAASYSPQEPIAMQGATGRHAFVLEPAAVARKGGQPLGGELECAVVTAGDSSSSWRELEALGALAAACVEAAGLPAEVRDVPAHALPFEGARAYALYVPDEHERRKGGTLVAMCVNHVDFVARARGWKQPVAKPRDSRTPVARFVHTLVLSFAPSATFDALAFQATALKDSSPGGYCSHVP